MTTQPTPHELLVSYKEVMPGEVWPRLLRLCTKYGQPFWLYSGTDTSLEEQHALDLIERAGERWLLDQDPGWSLHKTMGSTSYVFQGETPTGPLDYGIIFESDNLLDAIKWEVEHADKSDP